ncbi:MAG TPA: TonB-dependent receptor [Steroidobacteraceae bacterium]|nr:TonB-dependent receptor [Steroidobacteraceae bacterium]
MGNNPILRRAVRTALLSGGTVAGLMSHYSLAQAQAAPAAAAEAAPPITEVVVTGSRIATPQLESVSPITAVSAQEIKDSGVTRVEDLLNSLPQVVADQGSGLSMGSTGVANLDLRGLGVQRTLVLVNGRRLMPGDPTAGGASVSNLGYASAGDVNQIPAALVERVDVLTGGASSTYGADAVAGVVNFIMNDHFEGLRVDASAGIYNHSNHNDWVNPLLEARKFPAVTGTNWDGQNKDLALIMGHNFADGAGNMEAYLGYRRTSPITADHRDHAACVLSASSPGSPYVCGGSSNSAPTVFYNQSTFSSLQLDANGNPVPKYQRYNYAASHYLQRIDERYTAGFFGHLKFNEHVEAYTEFMFMDDSTRGNYAASGIFLSSGFATDPATGLRNGDWLLNCGTGAYGNKGMNPFLTQSMFNTVCAPGNPYGVNPAANGDVQLLMARRNVEGGPRQDEYTHNTWRMTFGLRGELSEDWTYDGSWTSSRVRTTDWHNNDTSSARMQNALLVVPKLDAAGNPIPGTAVCRGGQVGCVPWNIWNPSTPPTADQLTYFSVPGELQGYGEEDIFNAFVSGDLKNFKLPTAKDGLKAVFGTEYRRETAIFRPDAELYTADLAGNGSPLIGYDAGFHVWEGFTELRMPLVSDAPGAKSLDLEGGYRYSSYTSGFNTNTYKIGLTWAPINDVRLRGSYNRAVRAPNVAELYKPTYVGLDSGGDGCANGTYSAPECQLTNGGKPLPVYPSPASPAGQYNGQIGGNTLLQPEVGKTKNFGIVFTPSFLTGFSATVDYTDIKISNVITSYGPNLIQANCVASNDPNSIWCQTNPAPGQPGIHRDAGGTLWASPQGYTIDPLINLGQLENESIDVGLAYNAGLGSFGRLRSRLDGTYLRKLLITPGGGSASFDCAGYFGPDCTPATPKWRHRLSADWDTPLTGFSAGVTWRYFGEAKNELVNAGFPSSYSAAGIALGRPDPRLPTVSYIDLRASYTWEKYTVRVGCNNVADKDPPLFDTVNSGGNQAFAESNTFPSMYDTAGRYLYVNVTADF